MNSQVLLSRNIFQPVFKAKENIWLFLAVFCSFFVSFFLTNLFFKPSYNFEMTLGWLLALIFNFTGLTIKLFAVGRSIKTFFVCMFFLIPLNAAIFLSAAFFLIHHIPFNTKPFITSIFSAYFILLIYDIFKLRSLGLKKY